LQRQKRGRILVSDKSVHAMPFPPVRQQGEYPMRGESYIQAAGGGIESES